MKLNSKGADVTVLQNFLIKEGYLSGNADGKFGLKTESAVKQWQTDNGLRPDGIWGANSEAIACVGSLMCLGFATLISEVRSKNKS